VWSRVFRHAACSDLLSLRACMPPSTSSLGRVGSAQLGKASLSSHLTSFAKKSIGCSVLCTALFALKVVTRVSGFSLEVSQPAVGLHFDQRRPWPRRSEPCTALLS